MDDNFRDQLRAAFPNLTPAERSRVDQRFEQWWSNAGEHVTPDSPRKGLAYVAFCAGTRVGGLRDGER